MILLEGQLILKVPGFSYASIYTHPFSKTTVLTDILPLPNSPTPWLLEAFACWNSQALPFLEASAFDQGSIFSLFLLSVSKQGACNILYTSHICTVQSRSLWPQCFFLSIKAFLWKQGPPQLHLHGSLIAQFNILWDRADHLYCTVFYFYEKAHTTPTCRQSTT